MNIITEYPVWFIIFCLLLGGLYAFALYFRDRRAELPAWMKSILAPMRFVVVSIIAFLLLSPLVKSRIRIEEKPIVLFFQDNSSSITANPDSLYYRNEYTNMLASFSGKLDEQAEVKEYLFGDEIRKLNTIDFTDKWTNFSDLAGLLENSYANQHVAAVVIASDGIYNAGADPFYALRDVEYPVYTLALGDTILKPDVYVRDVRYNKIAFSGNEFPVEVNIQADKCEGNRLNARIEYRGEVLERKQLSIKRPDFNKNLEFMLKAQEPGIYQYSVVLDDLPNETNLKNNRFEIFVEVIDNRSKILILYNAPHPDVTAIRSTLVDNDNYELDIRALKDFDGELADYELLVLHQIPSNTRYLPSLQNQLKEQQTALLYILGPQSNLNYFNNLQTGLSISSKRMAFENAYPAFNQDFVVFSLDDLSRNMTREFPPLQVHFGNYFQSTALQNLFYQRIGNVVTDKPLIAFSTASTHKTGFITGTGLWRWRIENNKMHGNQEAFNMLMRKIVQYLVIRADKRKFRVEARKQISGNENVQFEAELYNDNFELVSEPEVKIVIEDETGNEYPYSFGKRSETYFLNAGKLPRGKYTYRAETSLGDEKFTEKGMFIVKELNIENQNLRANHNLLYEIASEHNGRLLYPDDLSAFAAEMNAREDMKPVLSYTKTYSELINLPWLMGLIIFLLAAEWFLRRWSGTY
ncbi:MAG: hypothetical protein U5Q03_20610 [Bacteroidota bacterium]|nr:hypothetical protein [Bacteroidota bacterium]